MKTKDLRIEKDTIEVYKTDNYDLFKNVRGNRPVKANRVKKIYDSIKEHGWFESSFIIIGEGMVTLDGQHRLQAVRDYKAKTGKAYKVRYVVDNKLTNIKYVQAMNYTQSNWTNDDFLHSYAELGNDNYIQYRHFLDKHKISHSAALMVVFSHMSIGGEMHNMFKKGKMVVKDWDLPNIRAERINDIFKYFKYAKTRRFVGAMIQVWRNPEFVHERFMDKLKNFRDMLYRAEDEWGYIRMIEDLYNYHSKDRIDLKGKAI